MNIWERLNSHHCIVSGLTDDIDIAQHPKIQMRFETKTDATSNCPVFRSVGPLATFLSKQFVECDCLLCPPRVLNNYKALKRLFAQTNVASIFLLMPNLRIEFFALSFLAQKRSKDLPLGAFCQFLAAKLEYTQNVYGYEAEEKQFIEISQFAHPHSTV